MHISPTRKKMNIKNFWLGSFVKEKLLISNLFRSVYVQKRLQLSLSICSPFLLQRKYSQFLDEIKPPFPTPFLAAGYRSVTKFRSVGCERRGGTWLPRSLFKEGISLSSHPSFLLAQMWTWWLTLTQPTWTSRWEAVSWGWWSKKTEGAWAPMTTEPLHQPWIAHVQTTFVWVWYKTLSYLSHW